MRRRGNTIWGFLCFSAGLLVAPGGASAAVFNVSNGADAAALNPASGCATANSPATHGACTLRSAVQAANASPGSSTIHLAPGAYKLTIKPSSPERSPGDDASNGDLEITNTSGTITISGSGSGSTTIDANFIDRAFDALSNTDLVLTGVTIRNGRTGGFPGTSCPTRSTLPAASGGAISAVGKLTLTGDALSGNIALGDGGGVYVGGTAPLSISSTRIDRNMACPGTTRGGSVGGGVSVEGGGPATIDSSTLTRNSSNGSRAYGGGLAEEGDDTIAITRSFISGNSTTGGGGGFALEGGGRLRFASDTISDNTAGGNSGGGNHAARGGGGVLNDGSDTDTYINTTITRNHGSPGGGILANSAASDALSFSTVNANRADSGTGNIQSDPFDGLPSRIILDDTIVAGGIAKPANCNGTSFTSNGHNLFDDDGSSCGAGPSDLKHKDPRLGPLANNGGPVPTEALQPGSPAIDAADDALCRTETGGVDERGISRPQGPHCDIGAYEFQRHLHFRSALLITTVGRGSDAARASGTVSSKPGGIACSRTGGRNNRGTCSAKYNSGTRVTLTATPDSHSIASLSGACHASSGTPGAPVSCSVRMNQARNVTATFTRQRVLPPPRSGCPGIPGLFGFRTPTGGGGGGGGCANGGGG